MPKIKVDISPVDAMTGKSIDPELIAKNMPLLVAWGERYGEFLSALGQDDDLAVIARTCAMCEKFLRSAIQEKLPRPQFVKWDRFRFELRLQLALSLELLDPETEPLLKNLYAIRNKILHDNPVGSVSESNVENLLSSLPKGVRKQLAEQRERLGSKAPWLLALDEYQRDLRLLCLVAYSACLRAERNAQGVVVDNSVPGQITVTVTNEKARTRPSVV